MYPILKHSWKPLDVKEIFSFKANMLEKVFTENTIREKFLILLYKEL